MTWHRDDGTAYLDRDREPLAKERIDVPAAALPQAPKQAPQRARTGRKAAAPNAEPIDPPAHTARQYLTDVLDRIKAGELAAVAELPAALNNARKESRQ